MATKRTAKKTSGGAEAESAAKPKRKYTRKKTKKVEAEPINTVAPPEISEPVLHEVDCMCGNIIVVFSTIKKKSSPTEDEKKNNQDDMFNTTWKRCDKCNVFHHIIDISNSMMSKSIPPNTTLDDLMPQIPKDLFELMDSYELDVAYYQYVGFLLKNGIWGKNITLSAKLRGYDIVGERLTLKGPSDYVVTPYITRTVLPTPDELEDD